MSCLIVDDNKEKPDAFMVHTRKGALQTWKASGLKSTSESEGEIFRDGGSGSVVL
jgi:hypothetical protein